MESAYDHRALPRDVRGELGAGDVARVALGVLERDEREAGEVTRGGPADVGSSTRVTPATTVMAAAPMRIQVSAVSTAGASRAPSNRVTTAAATQRRAG